MEQKGYGNFAFLYNINRELYTQLYAVEQKARLNYRECGRATRGVLEEFVDVVIRANNLDGYFSDDLELFRKVDMLSSVSDMRAAGYLGPAQTFDDKPLLPKMEDIKCVLENGTEKGMGYMDFLRKFGNSCSHREVKPYNPKICYDNMILCLRGYHLLLQRYYGSRLPKEKSRFDEDRMPIGEYVIYEAGVPADAARSKCVKEYMGYKPGKGGEPAKYVLIRTYDRVSTDDVFMLRNQDCFTEASKNSNVIVPEGMAQLQELTSLEAAGREQYIICYGFNQKPYPLNNELLRKLNMEQRLGLCRKIANCLSKLHSAATPIFHRMLNYESVYVCQINGEWYPYIVKFDYAKIVTDKAVGTVYMSVVESQNYLRKRGREKYLPPEWLLIESGSIVPDWAKIDIYALGVLMTDILKGEITGKLVSIDELDDLGVPEVLLEVLETMLKESPAERVAMKDVKEFFDEIG